MITPDGLGTRGAALFSQVAEGVKIELSPLHAALLVEACRIADRLDRLDAQLAGGVFLDVETSDRGVVEVVVDKGLAEARQQALAMKQIVSEIRQAAPAEGAAGTEGDQVDDLSSRRAARRSAAQAQ